VDIVLTFACLSSAAGLSTLCDRQKACIEQLCLF
jgi:hypothetical protein